VDEQAVLERARAHAQAMVAGDLRRAAADLSEEGRRHAPTVMSALPRPLVAAEVSEVRRSGGAYDALIVYRGSDSETTVVSRWEERGDALQIVSLVVQAEGWSPG
jgi:hypothetical protein